MAQWTALQEFRCLPENRQNLHSFNSESTGLYEKTGENGGNRVMCRHSSGSRSELAVDYVQSGRTAKDA
jgi:hypothetical protein